MLIRPDPLFGEKCVKKFLLDRDGHAWLPIFCQDKSWKFTPLTPFDPFSPRIPVETGQGGD